MPRTILILCAGISLLNPARSLGQGLPKNPTTQQVIGYRQDEQRQWNMNQLPSNTVSIKTTPAVHSLQYRLDFKKEKQPVISLPSAPTSMYTLPAPAGLRTTVPVAPSAQPLHYKYRYNKWLKQNLRNSSQAVHAPA